MAERGEARACTKCATEKPLDQYAIDRKAKGGRSRVCKPCAAAKTRAWSSANKERKAEAWRKYKAENLERVRAADKLWREKNAERRKEVGRRYAAENSARHVERVREWRKKNPERTAAMRREERARQRARLKLACPAWADREKIKAVYIEADRVSRETGIPHHVDHIIPLAGRRVCGLHVENNLRVIPASDNCKKSYKELEVIDGKLIPWAFLGGM